MIIFEYREVQSSSRCMLKAFDTGSDNYWECEVDLPYIRDHQFWLRDQGDSVVLKKSKQLAIKADAPEWVTK